MMIESYFAAAFMVGLVGAGHCLGMCGGIAGAIGFATPESAHNKRLHFVLYYNVGRLCSYVLIGAIVGAIVSGLTELVQLKQGLLLLKLAAGAMMIALGLYIAQVWHGLTAIEQIGQRLWRHLSPLATRLLPLRRPVFAFPLGLVWGWLPCGLVYSTLSLAASSGQLLTGAMIMLAFGLGTLPAMLAAGSSAAWIKKGLNHRGVKFSAALFLIGYGAFSVYMAAARM